MSNAISSSNGKLKTVADLENDATKIETNLEVLDKNLIKKMLNVLNSIIAIAQRKEKGIFNVILRWFRLYLRLSTIINSDDKKLLKYYEYTVPTVITYIIGCLQYPAKEMPKYHFNLLEILEDLIESIPPSVLKQITKFEKGTIGCLWNPINLAGDFNTQLKALKILSLLLKQFDENRQNEELKCIKWTNLNLFQDKLKTIVQETKSSHVLENCSRELLNNYNMKLAKHVKIYSFYCKSLTLSKIHKFYKPLNIQKFWIDINYSPKTISFSGRFKMNSSYKYENISATLKIQKMILNKGTLQIYFNTPGDFSKYVDYFSNIVDNVVEFALTNEEAQRLTNNYYILDYFNDLGVYDRAISEQGERINQSTFDFLKTEMSKILQENNNETRKNGSNFTNTNHHIHITSTPEDNTSHTKTLPSFESAQSKSISEVLVKSTKSSKYVESDIKERPVRNLRDRKKFFTSLMEESCQEFESKKKKRKRSQKTKSRQTRCKQVCKVTPTIDLTKAENLDSIKQNEVQSIEKIGKLPLKDNASKNNAPLISTQDFNEILKNVADIYDIDDSTYANPCQSYRNFQTNLSPIQKTRNIRSGTRTYGRKKKIDLENDSSIEKKIKLSNCYALENKENINPHNHNIVDKPSVLTKTKSILSPHLFSTQDNDDMFSSNKLTVTNKKDNNIVATNLEIDLTLNEIKPLPICLDKNQERKDNDDHISSSSSTLCEEMRGLNENYFKDTDHIRTPTKCIITDGTKLTTPRPTSCMNLSDSDMEITRAYNNQNLPELQARMCVKSAITLQDNSSDMELTHLCSPNFFMQYESESIHKNSTNLQPDCEDFEKDNTVPLRLQKIINDFDCISENEFESNFEAPTKANNYDIIPQHIVDNNVTKRSCKRDCIIFHNRNDIEGYSSTDEDSNYGELTDVSDFPKCNKIAKQSLSITQNKSALSNKNLCKEYNLQIAPDKNSRISKNFTSRISTSCRITPKAVILHQLEVSAKKSVILRKEYSKKIPKASKCLNDYFANKNTNSVEFERETFALQSQKLNNPKERNTAIVSKHSLDANLYESTKKNPIPMISYSEGGEISSQKQSKSQHTSLTIESGNKSFKTDLLSIIKDYDTNIKVRLDNIMRLTLKDISDKFTRKYLDITKTILKKSDENRKEVDQIRLNIGRLVRELERQCDTLINKSKEFDICREVTEQLLECITNMDVPNCIAKEYEDVIQKLKIEQTEVLQKVWRKYLDGNQI